MDVIRHAQCHLVRFMITVCISLAALCAAFIARNSPKMVGSHAILAKDFSSNLNSYQYKTCKLPQFHTVSMVSCSTSNPALQQQQQQLRRPRYVNVPSRWPMACRASNSDEDNDSNDKKSATDGQKTKSTKFSRIIDDFIGKRYGAGEAFYGRRTSDMSEEEYENISGKGRRERQEMENKPLRENAILLVGDVHSGFPEWIVFDLYERGFNIRLACTDKKKAIYVYGLPGFNVDIVELSPTSSDQEIARVVQGSQAIIFCGNFEPTVNLFTENMKKVQSVCDKVLDIAIRAQKASVGTVKKIIGISRYCDDSITKTSWLSFDYPQSKLYDNFKQIHYNMEQTIKSQDAFEFVVVRAPPVVAVTRAGSKYDLVLTNPDRPVKDSPICPVQQIGILDLAEAVVHTLIIDVSMFSFTAYEDNKYLNEEDDGTILPDDLETSTLSSVEKPVESSRIPRKAYYSILNMNAQEMKASYNMKSADAYDMQLTEDELVERYWQRKFDDLKRLGRG